MDSEAIFAVWGLIGLAIAGLTGALWDSPVAAAPFRFSANLRREGRHAMPR